MSVHLLNLLYTQVHLSFVIPDSNMGNGMNKILPGLYLGNLRDSKDKDQLSENNITHIVSAHDNAKPLLQGFQYHCIIAADSVEQDLIPYFEDCVWFIHKARSEGGNVLIHCMAGISRSTTLATAYILTVTQMDWKEILKSIKCSRYIANPNSGFQRQLTEFSHSKEIEVLKRKIKHQYPKNTFDDEDFLRQAIVNAAKSEDSKGEEYEDGINTMEKYSNRSNREAKVLNHDDDEEKDSSEIL